MPMNRAAVVQQVLDCFDAPRYLEVGVSKGDTFHALKARTRVAVDPAFRFDTDEAARENPDATYHSVPSDEYFGSVIDPAERFEVIYLDGLHTSEQTLRDLMNAIAHLTEDGVIVIDDVVPNSYHASLPDHKESRKVRQRLGVKNRAWMGDVYRLVFFVETFLQAWSYRLTEGNHGQMVLWRERRASVPERTIAGVGSVEFKNIFSADATFARAPMDDIVAAIRARG